MSNELEYYKHLVGIMLKTRGTRFTSAQLLVARDRFSVATLTILSVFLIAVSVALLISPNVIGSDGAKFFGALSVVASVWILVITSFDYALGRNLLAYRLHQNAIQITKLAREMERELEKSTPDMELIRSIAKRYEEENAETEVNHSPSDYKIYLFSRQISTGWFTAIVYPIRTFLFSTLIFCISVPSNLLVLLLVGGATIWYLIKK
jgi:SMODS and SLOG-associating 2TM effector domain family 5